MLKFIRRHEAVNGRVFAGRLQILADCNEVDIGGAHIIHHLHDIAARFTQPDHNAGFGEHAGIKLLDALQQAQGMEIARARADIQIERGHGFQIVIEHIWTASTRFPARLFAQKIRCQNLNAGFGRSLSDGAYGAGKMFGTAILQIVTVNGCDNHMAQTQLDDGIGHARGLVFINGQRHARRHIAKCAGAGANLTQYHESGVALRPAFANIRAGGLLANRNQIMRFDDVAGARIFRRPRCLDADPVRFAQKRAVRIALFFRVAGRSFELSMTTTMAFLYAIFRDEYRSGWCDYSTFNAGAS